MNKASQRKMLRETLYMLHSLWEEIGNGAEQKGLDRTVRDFTGGMALLVGYLNIGTDRGLQTLVNEVWRVIVSPSEYAETYVNITMGRIIAEDERWRECCAEHRQGQKEPCGGKQ